MKFDFLRPTEMRSLRPELGSNEFVSMPHSCHGEYQPESFANSKDVIPVNVQFWVGPRDQP
jgi:hypothetical protein